MPKNENELRMLAIRHNINFDTWPDEAKLPESHRALFMAMKGIEKFKIDDNAFGYRGLPFWRHDIKRRAEELKDHADENTEEYGNEIGWRLSLESEIFSRFNAKLVCDHCGHRIYRTIVEPPAHQDTPGLENRRLNRQECRCGLRGQPATVGEKLFACRGGEDILFDSGVSLSREPDKVYGLKASGSFPRILREDPEYFDSNGAMFKGNRICPFRESAKPLILPFLVHEAKSRKGLASFDSMETQTALPIWRLLKLQSNVLTDLRGPSAPLVWYFAAKGELWKVSGCYIDPKASQPSYHVIPLWQGDIRKPDDCLQLLLVTDYIFDWARDIYRESIIHRFQELVGQDGDEDIRAETNIASHNPRVSENWKRSHHRTNIENAHGYQHAQSQPSDFHQRTRCPTSGYQEERHTNLPPQAFKGAFDTEIGVVRNAWVIKTRSLGLLIKEDNAKLFFDSIESPKEVANFFSTSFRAMDSYVLRLGHENELHALNQCWIGPSDMRRSSRTLESEIFVKICISYYVTKQWEILREMSYVAISVNALKVLHNLSKDETRSLFKLPADLGTSVDCMDLRVLCTNLQKHGILHHLQAAFARTQLLVSGAGNASYSSRSSSTRGPEVIHGKGHEIRKMVFEMYAKCKTGNREPDESFLCCHEVQHELKDPGVAPMSIFGDGLKKIRGNNVFVYGEQKGRKPEGPNLCLFLIRPKDASLSKQTILTYLRGARSLEQAYYTIREGRSVLEIKNVERNSEKILIKQQKNGSEEKCSGELREWIRLLNKRRSRSRSPSMSRPSFSRRPSLDDDSVFEGYGFSTRPTRPTTFGTTARPDNSSSGFRAGSTSTRRPSAPSYGFTRTERDTNSFKAQPFSGMSPMPFGSTRVPHGSRSGSRPSRRNSVAYDLLEKAQTTRSRSPGLNSLDSEELDDYSMYE